MAYQSPGGAIADTFFNYQLDRAALQHQQLVDSLAVQRNRREDELEQLELNEKRYQQERTKIEQEVGAMSVGDFTPPDLIERAKKYNVPLRMRKMADPNAPPPPLPSRTLPPDAAAPDAGVMGPLRITPPKMIQTYAGTPQEQDRLRQQRQLDERINTLPQDSPERRQLEAFRATGKFEPASTFTQNQPEPVYRQNPRTGTIERVGDVPKGSHFMTTPAPPQPIIVQTGEGPRLVDRGTGRTKPVLDDKGQPLYGVNGAPLSTDDLIPQAVLYNAIGGKALTGLGMNKGLRDQIIHVGGQIRRGEIAVSGDVPNLLAQQADADSLKVALSAQMRQATFSKTAARTAFDNLDLALVASDRYTRTDAKFVNELVNRAVKNVAPAAGLSDFETKVYTAIREYAKVASGGAGSVAGLSDSATHEATALLNSAQSPQAFAAAVNAMKSDINNITANQDRSLEALHESIAKIGDKGKGPSSDDDLAARAAALLKRARGGQ